MRAMTIKIWVIWSDSLSPVDGAEYVAASPLQALAIAQQYLEIFEGDGLVNIHAPASVPPDDSAALAALAAARGITLASSQDSA